MMSLGAAALATLPRGSRAHVDAAKRLHAHCEKLHLVTCATGVKSIEIIQAELVSRGDQSSMAHIQFFILWGYRKARHVDDQRGIRLGKLPKMATAVGLHQPRARGQDLAEYERLTANDLRLRMSLVLAESR